MGKTPISFRCGDELEDLMNTRWRSLGYKTRADYIKSLIRYDGMVGGDDHAVTMPITQQSLSHQDRIDAEINAWVKSGKKGRGVLLERMIEKAITAGAKTSDEIKKQIGKDM